MTPWEHDGEPPLRDRYTSVLDSLQARFLVLAAEHEVHPVHDGPDWCAPDGYTICDEFGNVLHEAMWAALDEVTAEQWLADGPADLLDWYAELQGETPRDTIRQALHHDAAQRLFRQDNGWPRLP